MAEGARSSVPEYPIHDGHRLQRSCSGEQQWEPCSAGSTEGRASGRQALLPTELLPCLSPSQLARGVPGGPGGVAVGRGRVAEPVLMARHSPSPLSVSTAAARAAGSVPQCGLLPKYQALPKGLCPS